ncbi:5-(carboxyamino)imidazole ribonucleotide mutase [candidate division KSB1 bacterium]
MSKVAVIAGSKSDKLFIDECQKYLEYFGIEYETRFLSAHRNSEEVRNFSLSLEENGFTCVIAMAGMAAHLPGVMASMTSIPVIGVPLNASSLGGLDAALSILQMPAGIPVATMALDKAGARNSAVMAAKIIALQDAEVKNKLNEFKNNGFKI